MSDPMNWTTKAEIHLGPPSPIDFKNPCQHVCIISTRDNLLYIELNVFRFRALLGKTGGTSKWAAELNASAASLVRVVCIYINNVRIR